MSLILISISYAPTKKYLYIRPWPKVKDFMWKLVKKAIPLSENLATRGVTPFPCKACGDREDDFHVFPLSSCGLCMGVSSSLTSSNDSGSINVLTDACVFRLG